MTVNANKDMPLDAIKMPIGATSPPPSPPPTPTGISAEALRWYTADNAQPQTYLQIGFNGLSLAPGASTGGIQDRFNHADWSNYSQTNDYSFSATAISLAASSRVTVYANAALVAGTEPT